MFAATASYNESVPAQNLCLVFCSACSRNAVMALPIVAVIGRPNVGKSTLVNRLAGVTDAIVHDEPGVTRDRTYRPGFWQDREFLVVDTGGLVFDDDTEFLPLIREQAMAALAESSAAIMAVDGQEGPTPAGETIAERVSPQTGAVFLCLKKS